jgi:hypothetical protein
MLKDKYIQKPRTTRVRLKVSDFSKGVNAFFSEELLPPSYACLAYNFASANGAIKNSKGFEGLRLFPADLAPAPCPIEKLYFYRKFDPQTLTRVDKLIAYCGDKNLYYADIEGGSGFTLIEGAQFNVAPAAINYRLSGEDVIIFCSQEDCMTVWDGKNPPYVVESAPKISAACVHYERLFAAVGGEKSSVWFSDDLDPTNWDISLEEAGYIELSGEKGCVLNVIKFLDYVYIFHTYGISRLTAYSEQTEFSVFTLFVSSGKIYPDTVTICGDRIIFLAEDGIFSFDGYNVAKIMKGIFPLISGCANGKAVAAYYSGCYYLACKAFYGEEDGLVNNTLIEYDIAAKTVNLIKGADISSIAVISSENYNNIAFSLRGEHNARAVGLCESNTLFGTPLPKLWKIPPVDFDRPDKLKVLREIYLLTKEDISVKISCGNASKTLVFKGGQDVQKGAVVLKGRQFYVEFSSTSAEAEISGLVLTADIL